MTLIMICMLEIVKMFWHGILNCDCRDFEMMFVMVRPRLGIPRSHRSARSRPLTQAKGAYPLSFKTCHSERIEESPSAGV